MNEYPPSLLNIAGSPDRWQLDDVGQSHARVYYLPSSDAWLKCAPSGLKSEAEALRYLQGKAPVPRIEYYQEANGWQYLVTRSLPGHSCIDPAMLSDPSLLIHVLASALRELHALDITACPLDQRLSVKLHKWEFTPEERDWLRQHAPAEDLVFTHGDACLSNFFYEDDRYTGCLDLGDAGIADRWQDLSLTLWSLQYNLGTRARGLPFLETYGIKPDADKIEYYLRLNYLHGVAVL